MTTVPLRPAFAARGARLASLLPHRPLLWLAAAMIPLALFAMVGAVVDPRELTGAPLWMKPLKFAISVTIYAVTLSWLIGLVQRGRRVARAAGTVVAVFLAVEMVIIVGAAAAGTTSHFNVATPLTTALFSIMGASIAIVWMASLVLAALLLRAELGDGSRSLAIRAGFGIALVGMALGFLMTLPTTAQLNDFSGVAGAHTVGAADGGPGLPLVGWSTVAGDLRIPHFVGMHALQALPLLALLLELAARRVPLLRPATTRARLLWVAVGTYGATLAVLTAQALTGQSIVRPDGIILALGIAIFTSALLATGAVVAAGRRQAPTAGRLPQSRRAAIPIPLPAVRDARGAAD
jgi:hypothetical protein